MIEDTSLHGGMECIGAAVRLAGLMERRLAIPDSRGSVAERKARIHEPRVYYLTSETGGAIKIGTTVDFSTRFRRMQRNTPGLRPVLLAWELGDQLAETRRHTQFSGSRIASDWFWPTDEMLSHVEALREAL